MVGRPFPPPSLFGPALADEELFTHGCRHYIWATAAVYFTSVLIRFAVMLNRNGRHIARGHIEVLPDHAVRVTARLPRDSGHAWSAGQHYFVNFVKARPFESHPYTIANAPWRDPSSSVLSFLLRTLLHSLENPLAECQ